MTVAELQARHGAVEYEGKTYVLVVDAYADGTADNQYYTADAIIPAEGPADDGMYNAYCITWAPKSDWLAYAAECAEAGDWVDEGDACDWDSPDSVELCGGYDLATGRIM